MFDKAKSKAQVKAIKASMGKKESDLQRAKRIEKSLPADHPDYEVARKAVEHFEYKQANKK